jgi:hypothetical protein
MARSWGLPEEFATYIEAHINLDEYIDKAKTHPGQVSVALSSLLPPLNDGEWAEREKFVTSYQKLAPAGSPTVEAFMAQIDKEFTEFAPVLKLAVPKKTLADAVAPQPEPAKA